VLKIHETFIVNVWQLNTRLIISILYIGTNKSKKVDVALLYSICYKCATSMDVAVKFEFNDLKYCLSKMILSEDGLSAYT